MDACVWGGVFRTIINTSGKKASMCSREDRAVREMCPFCLAGGLLGLVVSHLNIFSLVVSHLNIYKKSFIRRYKKVVRRCLDE